MKKTLLLALATTVFTTHAIAESNSIYLRADVAANKFTKDEIKGREYKSDLSGSIDFGIGCKLMNTARAELVYIHHFHPTAKSTNSNNDRVGAKANNVKNKSTNKANIDALMIRGYFDVADVGPATLFIGAGLGVAQVKEEANGSRRNGKNWSHTYKKKNNMAYSLLAGTSFSLAEGAYLDLQYIWSDYGKAKGSSLSRSSNALSAGVRLEL